MTPDLTKQVLTTTAETVLARRYYLKNSNGDCIETWETLARRVADSVAAVDKGADKYEQLREDFFSMIYHKNNPSLVCIFHLGLLLQSLVPHHPKHTSHYHPL